MEPRYNITDFSVASLNEGEGAIVFDPLQPEFRANPYPVYQLLRSRDPIHRTRSFSGEWLLTRHADVKAVLSNQSVVVDDLPERLVNKVSYLPEGQDLKNLVQSIRSWLFFLNPPDHQRLRGLVSHAFSPGEVEKMRPSIQRIVDELIDRAYPTGQMDILTDLAAPLPAWVSSEILGVPAEDRNELTQLSYRLFRIFDQPMSLKGYQDMNQAALEFKDYFRALIARKEKQPRYDLIDKLIAVRDEGSKLSEEELLSFCAMLFSVGQETTENLIGNGVLALLNHPEQMAKLRDNPQFIQSTVEELLRYDNPVQIIARVTKKDIKIGGKTIRAGERIYFALGAANRDPDVFPNPDQLDITRQGTQNLPFGYGIHFCLGAALARIQGQVAINTVVRRLSDLKRSTNVLEWRENIVLRGLKALPVSFSVRG